MALQITKNGMKARTTTYQGEKKWKKKKADQGTLTALGEKSKDRAD